MSRITLVPIDRTDVAPLPITARLRTQLAYFMSYEGQEGVPKLGEHEFWFDPAQVAQWLDEGVILLVSPLDSENQTEVELSEEQEAFLTWLQTHQVCHIKVLES